MEIFHKIVMAELMKHAMILHALVVTNEMKALWAWAVQNQANGIMTSQMCV